MRLPSCAELCFVFSVWNVFLFFSELSFMEKQLGSYGICTYIYIYTYVHVTYTFNILLNILLTSAFHRPVSL